MFESGVGGVPSVEVLSCIHNLTDSHYYLRVLKCRFSPSLRTSMPHRNMSSHSRTRIPVRLISPGCAWAVAHLRIDAGKWLSSAWVARCRYLGIVACIYAILILLITCLEAYHMTRPGRYHPANTTTCISSLLAAYPRPPHDRAVELTVSGAPRRASRS